MAELEAVGATSIPESREAPEKGHSAGRHSAREVALQVLYAIDLGAHEPEFDTDPEAHDSESGEAEPSSSE